MLKIKRVYESPEKGDGFRVLVDRLWPRGVSKERAHLDLWLKEIAPSDALRKWFAHDPKRWKGFGVKYRKELGTDGSGPPNQAAREETTALLHCCYGAHDPVHNQAVVLLQFLKGARAK